MGVKIVKAGAEKSFLKIAWYGKTGSGKTFTALLLAEGLAKRDGKRVLYIDTEKGTLFYGRSIEQRSVHPDAFDFDRVDSRSLMDALEVVESLDTSVYGVVVIDSVSALWDAAKEAYNGKKTSQGGIPIQAWGALKRPYKKLISLLLDGDFHALICGREGVDMQDDEDGNAKVVGAKMKAESETQFEPHILARMMPERLEDGTAKIRVFFEKDRSGILAGRTIEWPNFETFAPVLLHLDGAPAQKLGSSEDAAERDAHAQEQREEAVKAERQALHDQIRTAILNANTLADLKAAWSLTAGKKTRLGEEHFSALDTLKDARKVELHNKAA